MTQAMPELLSQLSQHGISVTAAGPNIEVTIQKGKPDPRARLLLDQLKARKAEALRLLSGQPEPKALTIPRDVPARIAELEALIVGGWRTDHNTREIEIAIYEMNALRWLDLEEGATECDCEGIPWMTRYLEAQM